MLKHSIASELMHGWRNKVCFAIANRQNWILPLFIYSQYWKYFIKYHSCQFFWLYINYACTYMYISVWVGRILGICTIVLHILWFHGELGSGLDLGLGLGLGLDLPRGLVCSFFECAMQFMECTTQFIQIVPIHRMSLTCVCIPAL